MKDKRAKVEEKTEVLWLHSEKSRKLMRKRKWDKIFVFLQ